MTIQEIPDTKPEVAGNNSRPLKVRIGFVYQCLFLFVLGALFWYLGHVRAIGSIHTDEYYVSYYEGLWVPFLLYSGVGFTLLSMIYYATSTQVTPFRLITSVMPSSIRSSVDISVDSQTDENLKSSSKTLETVNASGIDNVDEILRVAAKGSEQLAAKM